MSSGTPASRAMASRCSTALVDPPVAATPAMAFSNAFRVTMSRGRRLLLHGVHHDLAAADAHVVLPRIDLRNRGRSHGRKPDQLHHRRHGVGRELAAARARAGARVVFDFQKFLIGHASRPHSRPWLRRHPES